MTQLKAGEKAPFFEGINQNGERISLNNFFGKKLILYFYPKDNTPGCTAESCNLNENYHFWLEKGFEVVGVSPDSVASHRKFADKFGLKFNLISDTETRILQDYGFGAKKVCTGKNIWV
jgi:peroxiredoxin Q/BCP